MTENTPNISPECAAAAVSASVLEQPLPTDKPNFYPQDNVFDHLIQSLREREEMGKQRYGQSLHIFNGRSALIDLQQECLDALVYTEQVKMEQSYAREVLEKVRSLVSARDFLTSEELSYINKSISLVIEVLFE